MFGQGFNSGFFTGPNYIYKEDIFGDNSCIGLYTMDYDFSDSSGNDNDMGVFGSPDHGVSGGLNLGARFDGYNTSARAYPVSDLQGLTSVSISFWFKWNDSASVSNYGHMVNIGDMGGVGNGDAFGIAVGDDGGSYNRVLYGWFPEGSLSTGQTVTDNVWHHVLMTYSGTTVKYYYDGNSTPISTQTRTSLSLQNSAVNRISVGHYAYNGNHHFKGDLDHLRVFNREIQSSELATLYNEKFYSPEATTTDINYPVTNLAYYKLDNNSKSEISSTHYLFIGDAGNSSSSGRLNSVDAEFTYTRPAGYSEWGGSWDPSNKAGSATQTFEESNKKWTKSGTYYNGVWSTNKYHSGKYYAEIEFLGVELIYGISKLTTATGYSTSLQNNSIYYGSWATHSWKYSTTNTAEGVILSTNDVIGLAADFDNKTLQVYRNNVLFDTVSIAASDGTETDIEYRFGRFGQAAVFNGSSSQITTSYTTNDSAFTISGWIKHTSTTFTSKYHYLAAKGYYSSASNTNYWYLANYSNANPEFRVRLNSSDVTATSSVAMNLNQWHHLAATLDSSGNMKIYLDGILTGSTTGAPSRSMSQGINFGTFSGIYHHDGQIDQIRYYPSVLDADAIQNLYNEKPETDTSNFKTVLYEGTGAAQYISNVGMDLETNGGLLWIKNRDAAYNNVLYDHVRNSFLYSNLANSQDTNTSISFEKNGFTTSSTASAQNANNNSYVAWNWKSGGDAVAGTGTGVTNVSISANTEAGFSIVKYTGGNSASDTVNHGLTNAEMIILKDLDDGSNNWRVWHKDLTTNYWLYLNLTNAQASAATDGGIRNVDSNNFGFINGTTAGVEGVNSSASNYIAYIWKSVAGYSKIGTYTGAGSGTRIYTTDNGLSTGNGGFKPSWVMLKNASVGGTNYDWYIYDVRRNDSDGDDNIESFLRANVNNAEVTSNTGSNGIVMEDDGFTLDIAATSINGSGNTFIYMAFK